MTGNKSELVVILHGIGMSSLRMLYIEYGLRRAGYATLNINYPSRSKSIEESSEIVLQKIRKSLRRNHEKIHFVAHSMGGLVTLNFLAQKYLPNISRVVLIAPPYGGSEVADLMANWALYKLFFGPAGAQLTTHYRKEKAFEIPPEIDIGVIAGTRAWEYPIFLSTMKQTGDHDGLVSVQSTQIPFMKDHITIRMSHSFLLERSVAQTVHFLRQGRFNRPE